MYHAPLEQHTVQQNDVLAEPDETQSVSTQLAADLETARLQTTQPNTQLVEEEKVETTPPQADLETDQDQIEEQQQMYTAYCLICRTHRHIEGAHQVTLANGRCVVKGHCAVCGIRFLEQL